MWLFNLLQYLHFFMTQNQFFFLFITPSTLPYNNYHTKSPLKQNSILPSPGSVKGPSQWPFSHKSHYSEQHHRTKDK